VTFPSQNETNSTGTPTYSISTTTTSDGCGLIPFSSTSGATTNTHTFLTQSLRINYSDGYNTTIFNSPNNAFYTTTTGSSWTDAPRTIYPYALVVPKSDNALTTITIIPIQQVPEALVYTSPSLPTATVEYRGNTNTGGTLPAPQYKSTYVTGTTSIVIRANTLVKTGGFTFTGWNTKSDGTGTNYLNGSTYDGSNSLVLYAKWTLFYVTYNSNQATSGTAPTQTIYTIGTPLSVAGQGNLLRTYYNFSGWNTFPDGLGTNYAVGALYDGGVSITLYAKWTQYTLTYNANGATGSAPSSAIIAVGGTNISVSTQGALLRTGFVFLGWNSSPSGIGTLYVPGYTFNFTTDTTLYAHWVQGTMIKDCGGGTLTAGTGTATINYYIPYAQIINNGSNSITIYTTALLKMATDTNYGYNVTAPFGIISISSKTVITFGSIQINVNTSYSNPANNYNYTKTIINGIDSLYWPNGQTISSITFPSSNERNSSSMPTYSVSTTKTTSGCGLTTFSVLSGTTTNTHTFLNQSLKLNFSDSNSNTIICNSPNNVFYGTTPSNPPGPTVWQDAPRTIYPYALNVSRSDNALTTISIIPSFTSAYIFPTLPNYTIEYDGNNETGGSLPDPQYMAPYVSADTSVLIRNSTVLKNNNIFFGWNTKANGSGTQFYPNQPYNGGASLRLYAKWKSY
jgi:hypothetical protein